MTDENTHAIQVRSLRKKFGEKNAVTDLTFHVSPQSITGFIGPNGAGKTTTLKIMATLLRMDGGSVQIFGRDILENSAYIRRQLGFMPDDFGLYEDMEVSEYLDFFAAAYHIPSAKRRKLINDLVELLDLTTKKNSLVAELSRGMQQRLSLGRALVHDPKLLLLDEPASGLDPRARVELMVLLRELRRMGKTILISSHILTELKDLCDAVVIIEQGKLVYSGTVAEATSIVAGNRLRVILKDKAEEAAAQLRSQPGILEIEVDEQTQLLIGYELDKIDAPDIIKFLITKGYELHEVIKLSANLEDVFMTLTEGGVA